MSKNKQKINITTVADAELTKMLAESKEKIRSCRFDLAAHKLKNTSEISKLRKSIARFLTEMKSRQNKIK